MAVRHRRQIIGITGFSAVGKSTLAKHLGEELGIGVFSLGNYQRAEFAAYGPPEIYHSIFGYDKTYYGRWPTYIAEISKGMTDAGIVVEGIYSSGFLDLMRQRFSDARIEMIRIVASPDRRVELFMKKTGLPEREARVQLASLDAIKEDVGLNALMGRIDTSIINNTDLASFLRSGEQTVTHLLRRG